MHLLEDGATVTGVQFNYPFSDLILKGELVTKPELAAKPNTFAYFLGISIIALFFGLELKYIPYANWVITIITILFLIVCWSIFLFFVAKIKIERDELKSYKNVKSLL